MIKFVFYGFILLPAKELVWIFFSYIYIWKKHADQLLWALLSHREVFTSDVLMPVCVCVCDRRSRLRMGLLMAKSWPLPRRPLLKRHPSPKGWWSLAGSKECW